MSELVTMRLESPPAAAEASAESVEKVVITKAFHTETDGGYHMSHEGGLASALPLLLADRNRGSWGNGEGIAAAAGGFIGAAFGNRRGGFFGGDGGDCGNGNGWGGAETRLQGNADTLAILRSVDNTTTAVNAGTAITSNNILEQTIQIAQGLSNLNNTVVNTGATLLAAVNVTNQNVSEQGCATRAAVKEDGDLTRALLISRFQQQDATTIAEQNARIVALETRGHHDAHHAETRLQITNTNTAVAAQAQLQEQNQKQVHFDSIIREFDRFHRRLDGVEQIAHATNQNIIAGNTGAVATGPQTANPTNVNTRS